VEWSQNGYIGKLGCQPVIGVAVFIEFILPQPKIEDAADESTEKREIVSLRVRPKINLHFQVLRRPHGKAREGRIAGLFNRRATQPCGMDRRMKM